MRLSKLLIGFFLRELELFSSAGYISINPFITMAETGFLPIDQDVETVEVMPLILPPVSKPFYEQQTLFVEALEDYLNVGSFVKMHIPVVNDDGTPTECECIICLIYQNSTGHIIVECYKSLQLQPSPPVLGNAMNLVEELYKSFT
jgi:hypothetical protein